MPLDLKGVRPLKIFHKFHAKPTEFRGRVYPSKAQARYAQELELRKRAGEVFFWLEEVPFRLPNGTIHRVDFEVFLTCGVVEFVEVKGYDTVLGKLKRELVESLYPITITVVRS